LVATVQICCKQMGVDEEHRLSCISYKWGQLYAPVSVTMFVELFLVNDVVLEEPLGGYSCSSQGDDAIMLHICLHMSDHWMSFSSNLVHAF
jgi:hypothetical protein